MLRPDGCQCVKHLLNIARAAAPSGMVIKIAIRSVGIRRLFSGSGAARSAAPGARSWATEWKLYPDGARARLPLCRKSDSIRDRSVSGGRWQRGGPRRRCTAGIEPSDRCPHSIPALAQNRCPICRARRVRIAGGVDWDHRRSVSTDTRPRFSMLVLPFANLGADPGQEQLVDAITSDLTTELSRIGHGFVISRNTAFTFHNRSVETKQIGRELGVRYLVEGAVRRLGNRVRVDAQLVDAETDALLWAQQFDGDDGDLFALEDDIARRIAIALGIELVGREAARPTRDPDAVDYMLRGMAVMNAPKTRRTYAEAISLFDRALTLDPRSVEVQSFLAIFLAGADVTDTAAADMARAEALAGQAVAASPQSTAAHMAQAMVLRAQKRFNEAIRAYDAVLTLNRNFVPAYANIAYAKLSAGSTEDAIQLLEEAIHRLSPRNSDVGSWYSAIGRAQLMEARADQAVFWLEKARGPNPMQGPQPHAWLASAHALEGESERAAAELAEARRLSSDDRYSSIGRLRAVIAGEPKAQAVLEATYFAGLRKAGMPEE